jgi:putative sugar O-methyltransferase
MIKNVQPSKQWDLINHFPTEFNDWSTFGKSEFFYKIGTWDPNQNGVRYLKMLLFNLASTYSKDDFDILKNITNKNLINPYTIKMNDVEVDFDYIQTIDEINCMSVYKNEYKKVLEIGAGYGRTCHALICNFPNIKEYIIFDLEKMLQISKKYLKEVLSNENFKKIKFIKVEKGLEQIDNLNFDLSIQIDAFNEMEGEDVKTYLEFVNKKCKYFYTKNPLGKYHDKSLDNHILGKNFINNALESGIVKSKIDIHDNLNMGEVVNIFLETYQPSTQWGLVSNSWSKPITFMWQALYKKNNI